MPKKEWEKMWKTKPVAASDSVVIKGNKILLVKRVHEPYAGWWTLPGGIMDLGETIEQTAIREVKEETGIDVKIVSLVGIYSGTKRDPRGTTLDVVYLMKFLRISGKPDGESSDVRFFPFNKLPKNIGFDHRQIIKDALKLLRTKEAKGNKR